jgi:hypothetical protein
MDSEEWQEKALEILECFLEGMQNDRKFTTPVEEIDDEDITPAEGWSYVYTNRGQTLAIRMIDRLNKMAERRWGFDIAFGFDISSQLYQEE